MRLSQTSALSVVVAIAGLSCGSALAAQPDRADPSRDRRMRDADTQTMSTRGTNFAAGTKMQGMSVKNTQGESLGSVDDMIIDRGSGSIRFLVLKSGTVLGLGGKLVTVPYGSFGWDHTDKHVTLNATPEEIKGWTEFDKKRWMQGVREDDSYIRIIGKDYYDSEHSPWPADTGAHRTISSVRGTIKSITRHTVDNGREELVVVVSSPDRPDREVILGPSWYMAGNNSIAFFREAPIEMEVFQTDRQGRQVMVARSAKINGKELGFYDAQGRAIWAPANPANGSAQRDAWSAAPFVLFSEIKGKPVDCRGESCGSVEDLIVECTSGRATFLSIDPDQAMLGIGDEDRLVPWTIMTRSLDGKVHLDASKSMISSAPTAPKDLKTLGDDGLYRSIFGAYDVQPVTFERARR